MSSDDEHQASAGPSPWMWRGGLLVFIILVAIIFWTAGPRGNRAPPLAKWAYPGGRTLTQTVTDRWAAALQQAEDGFSNVLAHYQRETETVGSGDPSFGGRYSSVMGIIPKRTTHVRISTDLKTTDKVTTFIRREEDGVILIHISRGREDQVTSILTTTVLLPDSEEPRAMPAGFPKEPMLDQHRFPGSIRTAGGNMRGLKSFRYEADAPLPEVWRYYSATNDLGRPPGHEVTPGDPDAGWKGWWDKSIALPTAEHEGTMEERAMIWLGPWGLLSLHAVQADQERPTRMVLTLVY